MWIVLLTPGDGQSYPYGPFDDETEANRFASFLTDEVDPAVSLPLRSSASELMNWRDMALDRLTADFKKTPSAEPPAEGDRTAEPTGRTRP